MKTSDGVLRNGGARRSGRSMDFERLIKDGERSGVPGGFVAQTANGTATVTGVGWNQDEQFSRPAAKRGGPWQDRRSTRTGE